MRREIVIVAGWLAGVCTAAAVGMATISALGDGVIGSGNHPMSTSEVLDELARNATPVPNLPTTDGAGPAGSSPSAEGQVSTRGGSVLARCDGELVTVFSWSPAQGYQIDGQFDRGPIASAEVRFKSRTDEVRLTVTCQDGVPRGNASADD